MQSCFKKDRKSAYLFLFGRRKIIWKADTDIIILHGRLRKNLFSIRFFVGAKMIRVDNKIIDGVNKGDEQCFKQLFDTYWSYLCSFATTYIPEPDTVEEIVNDVFLSIWTHRGRYRAPIHGYLINSVRNACVTHLRSKILKERLKDGFEKELLLFAQERCLSGEQPLEMLSAKETEEKIRAIAKTLPERCRQVFERYFYAGESTDAIAEQMNISQATVRVHIKTALDRLKSEMGMAVLFAYIFGGIIS